MKIETFICDKLNETSLKAIEKTINAFTTSHKTVDIKVNTAVNSYGAIIIYTVLYEEE